MRKFITELKGKTVMTNDGQILGMIENFLVNTSSGDIQNVLVVPAEEVETRLYKTDAQGRLVLPFSEMRPVRDVGVMSVSYARTLSRARPPVNFNLAIVRPIRLFLRMFISS